ncbi:hypothetical protein F53441_3540 [Fusarium austroafricanum]|uniref:Uncharacterized protein n=1 Tax=Fusarium austroafricanum TaxID=2364996 RepID=A0A8H4NWL0_9HYPO|nr:hypothetical protein F53441_3540 [Fusarium austroafricanum]
MASLNDNMSNPSSPQAQEPSRIPTLPNEIILKTLQETTQKDKCQRDRDGKFGEGKIEELPLEHKCIYHKPVADGEIEFKLPDDESWELALRKNRLIHQLHVYDRPLNPDLVASFRPLWDRYKSGNLTQQAFSSKVRRIILLVGPILDDIPFNLGFYRRANQVAHMKRLTLHDKLLECQRRKHIMIRSSPWAGSSIRALNAGGLDQLISQIAPEASGQEQTIIHFELVMSKLRDHKDLLHVDWSLMTCLESLCLDLSAPLGWNRNQELEDMCMLMERHLKLKTLVVLGLPLDMDYHNVVDPPIYGENADELWLEILETKGYIHRAITQHGQLDIIRSPTYIFWLKECLQPGGKLHLLFLQEPRGHRANAPQDHSREILAWVLFLISFYGFIWVLHSRA